MNKMQLIEAVATQLGVSVPKAAVAVDTVLDAIVRAVVAGERVTVTGFGSFDRVDKAARTARNPQNGEPVAVPARMAVRFRPGQNLTDLANGTKDLPAGSAVRKADKGSLSGGAR